ncbi:suppressor of npr1-1 constitutive 4 [Actinidia rufa]|uniref:Suppressor of npr1-1 constitutive 4 n=1 Tax=Actinidia rufa TaxID=165716 RepID=A0A7J0GXZ6_9ERIC|nr:suppressor of npr1-1 constitutive 4 [Actinidia rufa]
MLYISEFVVWGSLEITSSGKIQCKRDARASEILLPSAKQIKGCHSPWHPTNNQILLSPNSVFAAGFQALPTSQNLFFFAVWYHNVTNTTVVWSANDGSPVTGSATLFVTRSGELRLNGSVSGENFWPGEAVGIPNSNTTRLTLSRDGELAFGNWSSFKFPTDTILPNQNITGLVLKRGDFEFVSSSGLVFNGSDRYWAVGNGFQKLQDDGKVLQENGASLISSDFGATGSRRLTLDDDGNLRMYSLDPGSGKWVIGWQAVQELCQIHGTCGPNSICMSDGVNTPYCVCPPGFRRVSGKSCERKIELKNPRNTKMLYGYWSPGTENAMFLRVDGSEIDESNFTGMTNVMETTCPVRISLPLPPEESNTTTRNIVIVCTLFAAELISGVLFFWAFLKKYIKYRDMARTLGLEILPAGGPKRFSYAELKDATNNFSNIIGKGGFGDVYKGELSDHRVVAVKCLKSVAGGDADFWTEVTIIARMHHLNLTSFFSLQTGSNLRNPNMKRMRLWTLGTSQYLIGISGDDFCPKIADFGLAKLKKKEAMVSKSHFRGTRGYMAPEWVKMDPITSKADVYSFGMVLLEIVSGVRNNEIQESKMYSEEWYFPGWAFEKVFKEMKVEDILDRHIKHCYDNRAHFDMVNRMVKTAMWCLQERAELRPSMGKVAKMLEGTVEIMEPKKPTIFYLGDD